MIRHKAIASLAMFSLAPVAFAQLIRPDSATATSEFSASYLVTNSINGSGLPANFGPDDPHATYAVNNHWTTRSGDTIGHSATYTFSTPQTIGGFYMWAHRSNGVASNPYYAVTRFDLVLRDGANGAGNVLATFADLTGEPSIAAAQRVGFDVTAGVRSIQFIVRATANNNISPYTGLAEVAFTDCLDIEQANTTSSMAVCPGGEAVLTADVTGSTPLTYQWRFNGEAIDAQENPSAATASLVLLNVGQGEVGEYECLVTNPCGEFVTNTAMLALCAADIDCDGFVTGVDYDSYVALFEGGDNAADFDGDGFVTGIDFDLYVIAFEKGC